MLIYNELYANVKMTANENKSKFVIILVEHYKVEFVVPLHPIAETIISHCRKANHNDLTTRQDEQTMKEKGDGFVFHPDSSRSVMNSKLYIVGKACGIS